MRLSDRRQQKTHASKFEVHWKEKALKQCYTNNKGGGVAKIYREEFEGQV